jgi:nucleotide-binding universal stress UspA family protein
MYRHLLVPVDGTDASIEALGQAVEFAQSAGARITFCALPAGVIASGESAQQTDSDMTWELLARAEAAARAQGVPCSLAVPGVAAPPPIAETARVHGCDLICVASRRPPSSSGILQHGTTTIDGGDIAVLTCAVDSRPAVAQAIGILLAGQRTIAAHLHTALRTARLAHGADRPREAASLQEIARRMSELRRPIHHSMTEALFARLRAHTCAIDAELDELGRQHQRAAQMFDELAPLIACDDGSVETGVRLEERLHACAQFTWENMGRKEGVVLPAARRYLSDADWNALVQTFGGRNTGEPPRASKL